MTNWAHKKAVEERKKFEALNAEIRDWQLQVVRMTARLVCLMDALREGGYEAVVAEAGERYEALINPRVEAGVESLEGECSDEEKGIDKCGEIATLGEAGRGHTVIEVEEGGN